jgi:N-acetylglucosaminyldiphosphoundecaprenol N-acetyl-beta-D-mannosaminyltransferase
VTINRQVPGRKKVTLMGIGIDSMAERDVVERVVSGVKAGRGGWLVNPNVDVLRLASRRPDLAELITAADLVVADGMPLMWASRIQGTPLPERVAGASLIHTMSARAAQEDIAVFLLGGEPDVAEHAAGALTAKTPGLRTGWHFPPYGFEDDPLATTSVHSALEAFGPAIVYCGLGFPKQERLMCELHDRYPTSWFIGSGAAIGFAAGHLKRAPVWMQNAGLEWLHRLAGEPRRLFRRYVIDDIPFALRLLLSSVGKRSRRSVA